MKNLLPNRLKPNPSNKTHNEQSKTQLLAALSNILPKDLGKIIQQIKAIKEDYQTGPIKTDNTYNSTIDQLKAIIETQYHPDNHIDEALFRSLRHRGKNHIHGISALISFENDDEIRNMVILKCDLILERLNDLLEITHSPLEGNLSQEKYYEIIENELKTHTIEKRNTNSQSTINCSQVIFKEILKEIQTNYDKYGKDGKIIIKEDDTHVILDITNKKKTVQEGIHSSNLGTQIITDLLKFTGGTYDCNCESELVKITLKFSKKLP